MIYCRVNENTMITALYVGETKVGKEVKVLVQPTMVTADEAKAAAFLQLADNLGWDVAQRLLDTKDVLHVQ